MLLAVAPDVPTPVGAARAPLPPPPSPPPLPVVPEATWSTIALSAVICPPAWRATALPSQPIQSQQPFGLASEPLAAVERLVLSTCVCGNSTMMELVSAQRV